MKGDGSKVFKAFDKVKQINNMIKIAQLAIFAEKSFDFGWRSLQINSIVFMQKLRILPCVSCFYIVSRIN